MFKKLFALLLVSGTLLLSAGMAFAEDKASECKCKHAGECGDSHCADGKECKCSKE